MGTCIVFSIWWFGINNQSMEENFYSREEFHQDLCQIYFDLGRIAERRGDVQAAIRAYHIALEHLPNFAQASEHLYACIQSTTSSPTTLL
jgi:tetratricopeptide (TPR) repeat protein